jgi:uncharacterized protein YdhG (YjbR/CyaY superfamily)
VKKIPSSVASYYGDAPISHKPTLLEMRRRILEVIPEAEEVIKYAMPTFMVNKIPIAGLMWHKNHIGYYPYSGSVLADFPELESKYKTSKGAVQIPIGAPLLKGEVKKLIRARLSLL